MIHNSAFSTPSKLADFTKACLLSIVSTPNHEYPTPRLTDQAVGAKLDVMKKKREKIGTKHYNNFFASQLL